MDNAAFYGLLKAVITLVGILGMVVGLFVWLALADRRKAAQRKQENEAAKRERQQRILAQEVLLQSGQRIVVRCNGPTEVRVRLWDGEKSLAEKIIDCKSREAWAARILVSPSQRYFIVVLDGWVDSPVAAEERYDIFATADLADCGGMDWGPGGTTSFGFLQDESSLAALTPLKEFWRVANATPSEAIAYSRTIPFAELRIHELPNGPARLYPVDVSVPGGWTLSNDYYRLRCPTAEEIRFEAPWGENVVQRLPLPQDKIVLDYPS